jgi:hypothetical protein
VFISTKYADFAATRICNEKESANNDTLESKILLMYLKIPSQPCSDALSTKDVPQGRLDCDRFDE